MLAIFLCFILGVHERLNPVLDEKLHLAMHQPGATPVPNINAVIVLPALVTSDLVKTFNGIAKDSSIPVDDVAYILDNVDAIPYMRYRITLTTKAEYSQIRKFVAILSAEMPNVTLDTIRCSRTDIAATDLGCELVFSGFFSRAERG